MNNNKEIDGLVVFDTPVFERSSFEDSIEGVRVETPFVPILGWPNQTITIRVGNSPLNVAMPDAMAYFRVSNTGQDLGGFSPGGMQAIPAVVGDVGDVGMILAAGMQSPIFYGGNIKALDFVCFGVTGFFTVECWQK